jgi:hypothetical protein
MIFEQSKAAQPLALNSKTGMTQASLREQSTGKYRIEESIVYLGEGG